MKSLPTNEYPPCKCKMCWEYIDDGEPFGRAVVIVGQFKFGGYQNAYCLECAKKLKLNLLEKAFNMFV